MTIKAIKSHLDHLEGLSLTSKNFFFLLSSSVFFTSPAKKRENDPRAGEGGKKNSKLDISLQTGAFSIDFGFFSILIFICILRSGKFCHLSAFLTRNILKTPVLITFFCYILEIQKCQKFTNTFHILFLLLFTLK